MSHLLTSHRFISRRLLTLFVVVFALLGGIGIFLTFASNANLPGDENNDGVVNTLDLSVLLTNWGRNNSAVDLDSNGSVGVTDLSILLSHWGQTGPIQSSSTMPTGDVTSGGHTWRQVLTEDFTKSAALGSWGEDCSDNVVYTGTTGTRWKAYPECYLDTYQKRPYRSDQVLSVHDGTLDFWLHTVDGRPAGANPSPVFPNGSQYQTYGRYSVRIRQTTTNLSEFYQAWLLWPQNENNWQCAESDFPEGALNGSSVTAFAHYGCNGAQDYLTANNIDKTAWHVYTQEWMPGRRNYYVDGNLIGTSTNQVYSSPERWQLQTETNTNCESSSTCTQEGHLLVDWAVVYSY